jgi:hypothetical protein
VENLGNSVFSRKKKKKKKKKKKEVETGRGLGDAVEKHTYG